jgi:6-pyruvoyltetrahydropterin/6-carboxytetrahydropterin synthase
MYEVGLATTFTATHVMPGVEGLEGTPHDHDYRIEVVIASPHLDELGMVCDLDRVKAALDRTVAVVRDQDLEIIRPKDAEAVTVEVLARWAHDQLCAQLGEVRAASLSVRVWESPEAFGGYTAPVETSS